MSRIPIYIRLVAGVLHRQAIGYEVGARNAVTRIRYQRSVRIIGYIASIKRHRNHFLQAIRMDAAIRVVSVAIDHGLRPHTQIVVPIVDNHIFAVLGLHQLHLYLLGVDHAALVVHG